MSEPTTQAGRALHGHLLERGTDLPDAIAAIESEARAPLVEALRRVHEWHGSGWRASSRLTDTDCICGRALAATAQEER